MGYKVADIYTGLRDQALRWKPDGAPPAAYGLLMETGSQDGVVTLVASSDPSVSLYFSNGGGIIGTGEHEDVAIAVRALIEALADNVALLRRERVVRLTTSFPLPQKKRTVFYLLTPDGVMTAEAKEDDLGNNRHALSGLFHSVHGLIALVLSKDFRPRMSSPTASGSSAPRTGCRRRSISAARRNSWTDPAFLLAACSTAATRRWRWDRSSC